MACACAGLGATVPSFNYSTYLGLQQALNYLGIPDSNGNRLSEDGSMGPSTRSALLTMQKMAMIQADGQYGPQSQAALRTMVEQKAGAVPVAPSPSPSPSPAPSPAPSPTPAVVPSGGGTTPAVTPAAKSSNTMYYVAGAAVLLGVFAWYSLKTPGRR